MSRKETVTPLELTTSPNRLLVVSNRLPVVLLKNKNNDGWSSKTGSGGLVSALMPVLRDRGGVWIGWPGVVDEAASIDEYLDALSDEAGYGLKAVDLSEEEVEGFYEGFSNDVIWPLFHDLRADCYFDPAHWDAYREVNRRFASKVADTCRPGDVIWVHDYHLIGIATGLRRHAIDNKVGFFLHIPFPPPDIFLKLPWRADILSGLLEYDLVGFQTLRDRRNFQRCLKALYKVQVEGRGQVLEIAASPLNAGIGDGQRKRLRIGSFPISIDFDHYANLAKSDRVSTELQLLTRMFGDRCMILSVDRLDYTKGLLTKLRAFRLLLERHTDLHERVVLSLHVVPSRENIPQYHKLRIELEQLISEINGRWSSPAWIPVHYFYHSLTPEQLSAYYRRADIMFVSPLKDGMNLVAKEYCASHPHNDGLLVLSEFAGAAAELQKGALLINPYDDVGTAETLYEATRMPPEEIYWRMSKLRNKIRRYDIYRWVNSFLQAIAGRDLRDFPIIEDYVPGPPPEEQATQPRQIRQLRRGAHV
ncbi:MAG: trehalose-6-phosphate synthase [Gammaproteobacteria bacterium]|nr:trehalose-6-phosphate synthase [Gammaproteobacteria bacterium]